jgi:hypothetical protein
MRRPSFAVWPSWTPSRWFWVVLAGVFGVAGGVCLVLGAASVMAQ